MTHARETRAGLMDSLAGLMDSLAGLMDSLANRPLTLLGRHA